MNAASQLRELIGSSEIERIIARLAHQIIEPDDAQDGIVLIGIRRGGENLARRLAAHIERITGTAPALGFLNITLYRDDHVTNEMPESEIPSHIVGQTVVIVDDVLFTGRTIRSALDAIMDLGRPAALRLCVLIDRGSHELPITADYVGRSIPTSRRERISVEIAPTARNDDSVTIDARTS
ncbi:MAG: bifunctional pyr operon transcriptional regulator/uracil phosphoribosyltransferase PyrR [Vulcanimicrobiaceae bacterium]